MARKLLLTILALLVLYALAGFIALPWWLERALPERLAQHMGWQAAVEDVRVNPFAMSLTVSWLAADDSDGEPVMAFDRLALDLGFLQLLTGVIALQSFELDEPFARLDLEQDNSINLASDWQANNPSTQEPGQAGSGTSDPLKLFLGSLRIVGGEILFRDFSQNDPEEFRISPLDLSLNNLATWPREKSQSNDSLLAAIGNQTIEWKGDLSITPLSSSGFFRIADVSHETLAHFLKSYLPYTLGDGRVTVSSDYQLRAGPSLSLTTSGGEVTITDLSLSVAANSETEWLGSRHIHIPDVEFGLIERELSMGTINIDGVKLGLSRDKNGNLNLLAPFSDKKNSDPQKSSDPASADAPFHWSLAGIQLQNGQVNWRDNQPANVVDLTLEKLGLSIGQFSHKLSEPVDYQAELTFREGGQFGVQGQTTLQPFTLEAGIGLADINLSQLGAYLADFTNLSLRDGLLSLDGNLNLDNQQQPLTGTFSGTGQVAALDLRLADSDAPVLAWKSLRLEPLEYNLAPARLEIGTLTLSDPNVKVIREATGQHNLARIMSGVNAEPSASKEPSAIEEPSANKEPSDEFIFRIGQILLENGEVSYADRTLEPVFATRIDRLNGSVTGLSSVSPQQGQMSIKGRVGDVASLKLDGSIGALGTDQASELALEVDDVSLPALSPYIARYLGYDVQSGKLGLNLDYRLSGTSIDAENRILLDRMELGSAVASDQAINAPVKLGLALLRDRQGVIDIELPIRGDLADPQFRIGPLVMRTFVNLVAKAATSPFSVLGSLADMAGLTGEELGYVSFEPGTTELAPGGGKKLEVLSQALGKRPSLLLQLQGAVSPSVDGDVLRRQKLAEQLVVGNATSAMDRIARLESRYKAAKFEQPLAAYRREIDGVQDSEPDAGVWEKALVDRLIARIELPGEALSDLARARGVRLKERLQQDLEVPEKQLFLMEPTQKADQDERGAVKVNFALEAR